MKTNKAFSICGHKTEIEISPDDKPMTGISHDKDSLIAKSLKEGMSEEKKDKEVINLTNK